MQTCIVHLIRATRLDYASWKDRKAVAAGKPASLRAAPRRRRPRWRSSRQALGAAVTRPSAARGGPGSKVIPFLAFPPEVRRIIYTTNAIESVNARLRKIIKTRGHVPTDEAATKLLWLALRNITADWSRATREMEVGDEPIRNPVR